MSTTTETATGIRPFSVEISQKQIDSLRRRIEATRWPTYELVHYASQGIQLAFPQELARYRAEGQTGDLGRDPRAPSAETAETRTPSLLA